MKIYDTVILGGGASGMMCALRLAECGGKKILILERNDRLGKKLSATGNGQGNVTNAAMGAEHYFTTERKKIQKILEAFDERALQEYLVRLGGLFFADEEGRVYPLSRQASSVTDLLRMQIARSEEISVALSEKAIGAERNGKEFFVRTESDTYRCAHLVLAAGGKAARHFGTDGNAYALAKAFGHSIAPLSPALVQMKTPQDLIRGMKGIRTDCEVSLYHKQKLRKSVRGDVIFTDYGVSGNAIFKLSSYLSGENDLLQINFLPEIDERALTETLERKIAEYPDLPAEYLLCAIVNNSIARSLLKSCGIGGNAPCGKGAVPALVASIREFPLAVTGTLGFDYAQVTRGGVPTEETDERLMSRLCPELYFTGEILNVDGECGGYNLQWAFSSANCVAAAIAERGFLCGNK